MGRCVKDEKMEAQGWRAWMLRGCEVMMVRKGKIESEGGAMEFGKRNAEFGKVKAESKEVD